MKVIDLFCGTGGFSKGFEATGNFEIIAGIDIQNASVETFSANHKNAASICADLIKTSPRHFSRLTNVAPNDVDVIIGGPPCQGFSSIRPFRSLEFGDPRNNLYEQFALYVSFFRPYVFVLENVVGLMTYGNGKMIEDIRLAFESLNYSTDWMVINSVNFGLPQRRERIIMIGVQRKKGLSFPSPSHYYDGRSMAKKNSSKVLTTTPLEEFILRPAVSLLEAIHDLPEVRSGESADYYLDDMLVSDYALERKGNTKVLTLHESTNHGEQMLEIIRHSGNNINCIPKHLITSGFSTSYSRLSPNEPSVTLTVNFVHPASNKCIHPYQDRALTPREGARLQGFDDDFIFCGSRTQVVKQIGNTVPPLLGKVIAESIISQID